MNEEGQARTARQGGESQSCSKNKSTLDRFSQPTALGYAFVAAQALVVGIFAELEFIALRRSPALA